MAVKTCPRLLLLINVLLSVKNRSVNQFMSDEKTKPCTKIVKLDFVLGFVKLWISDTMASGM